MLKNLKHYRFFFKKLKINDYFLYLHACNIFFLNKKIEIFSLKASAKKKKDFINKSKINFFSKFRKICFMSGRSKGNVTRYGLSRFWFKNLAWSGFLVGLRRYSW